MADKQALLDSIRSALGREKVTGAPARLPAFSFAATTPTEYEIANQFSSELEKVSGQVRRIQSPDAMKGYVENLMPKERAATVAVSDAAVFRAIGLREWLAGRGASILPTFKEFASAEMSNQDSQAKKRDSDNGGLIESYKRALLTADIGITTADYAIADTGTLVLVSDNEQHRLISLVPPVHVCLLDSKQTLASLPELLARVRDRFGSTVPPVAMTFITGPSRTADIELSLTLGVHGPRELHALVY